MGPARIRARRALTIAATGALLALVALVFDAAPLFVPAVAFALVGLGAPAWIALCARGGVARRRLVTGRVIEDEALEAVIEVRRGPLGLPGAELVDPFTGRSYELAAELALIGGDTEVGVSVVTHFARRGLHHLPAPTLSVGDPLGLAVATRSGAGVDELLVLPRTEPVRWLRGGQGRAFTQPDGADNSDALAAVDIDGLRPYRPGTPASRIHWPAVARGHGLIERRLQADGDSRPLVVLDGRVPAGLTAEVLDAAVRAAASLVLELARGGGCGLLLPGEQRPTKIDGELAVWPAAYARLALIDRPVADRAPVLGSAQARRGAMIYVAAAPNDRLAMLLARPGSPRTVLVVPEPMLVNGRPRGIRGSAPGVLAVSGCRGFLIGATRAGAPVRPEATPA